VVPEPRLGVVLVRVGDKAREGAEVVRAPFPEVPDHLPQPERAVAVREGCNVHHVEQTPVQVGVARRGRLVSPGIEPHAGCYAPRVPRGLGRGGQLPLRLGRQAASGPAAVGLGLVPVDVDYGLVRGQRLDPVEVAAVPLTVSLRPVDGVLSAGVDAPVPALLAPHLALSVPPVVHEGGELLVGYGGAGHLEGSHLYEMRPLLVVEDEGHVLCGAEHELAARDLRVSLQRTARLIFQEPRVIVRDRGRGQTVRLAGVGERLAVHVLVEGGELDKVLQLLGRSLAPQALLDLFEHLLHVLQGLLA
jgi:hypothetical protein